MQQMGADTTLINQLITLLQAGHSIETSIEKISVPASVKEFLLFTFHIAKEAPLHVKAAVFTFGREDLIPDMFTAILQQIYEGHPEKVSIFKYYIERHIEVDGGHHSQLATEMVSTLCGEDPQKWEEATQAALTSLKKRAHLWDAILQSL